MVNRIKAGLDWLADCPARFYLLMAIGGGFVMLFLTPPMQVPDEPAHFFRAYQLAEGRIIAEQHDGMTGGRLPSSLREFKRQFDHLPFKPAARVEKGHYRKMLDQELSPEDKRFLAFEVTALYSPVPYAPQVVGVWLGKLFHAPPIVLVWLGRAFNLLFAAGVVFFAIRLAPAYRWVFVLIAMMPMALFQKSSLSPDALTNAFAILFVALIMRYSLTRIPVNRLALLTVVTLLGMSKNAYVVLFLLLYLVPAPKYGRVGNYFRDNTIIAGIGVLAAGVWSLVVSGIYVPFTGVVNIDPGAQLAHIMSNISSFLYIVWFNTFAYWDKYLLGMVGQLGWVDTPMPMWLISLYVGVLVLLALVDVRCRTQIGWWGKALIFLVLGLGVFLVKTLLYLSTEPVGSDAITTVQGRYYIPLAAVTLLLLYGSRLVRYLRRYTAIRWLREQRGVVAVATVLISVGSMIVVLSDRYYL